MEYAHIFDVEVWVARPYAARSEVSRLDQTAIRVQIVNDWICVLLLRGREDDDLEVLVGRLEALASEWTNVDAGKNGLGLLAKLDWDDHVGVLRLYVINTVNQCLIKIEYDRLCLRWVIWFRKVNEQMLDALKGRHSQSRGTNIKQGLHSLIEVNLLDVGSLFTFLIVFVFGALVVLLIHVVV